MLRTFRSVLASLTIAAGLAISAASMPVALAGDSAGIALLELEHPPLEQAPPLAWLFGSSDVPTMRELLDKLEEVAKDKDTKGLVIRLRNTSLRGSQVEELGKAFADIRNAGKKIHLFADGYDTSDFYLGSFADELIVQSGGAVSLPGMYMEEMYLADTMSWAGLTPQMIQVGDYKGANETMTRAAPSPQWDQNINSLLDSMYSNVRDRIKSSRKLDDAKLDQAMKDCWMATGETAKKAGLIDTLLDLPNLTDHLKTFYKADDITWNNLLEHNSHRGGIDMSNPLGMLAKMSREPDVSPKRDSIAVVHVSGPIIDGDSTEGGLMGEPSVGSHTIRRAFEQIYDEDMIKGVVIRIDSPGGSAIASEVIWQGVKRLREKKPVWISVASMAASGGYYIAVSGEKIYVNPSSIVGSIGVVGGKIAMGGLYEKAKIHVVGRERGPRGSMMSSATPWTDDQKAYVREKMKETYDLFASRVSAGRTGIDLSKTAEGRLFTGHDAVKLKMADVVGGLDDAIKDMGKVVKLTEGEYDILDYPGPKAFREVLGEFMGKYVQSPSVASSPLRPTAAMLATDALREVVGPTAWPAARDNIRALLELRKEPVLLTSPTAIIIK